MAVGRYVDVGTDADVATGRTGVGVVGRDATWSASTGDDVEGIGELVTEASVFTSGSSGSLIAVEPSALVITLVETCLLLACALKCFANALGPPKLRMHRGHLCPRSPVCLLW